MPFAAKSALPIASDVLLRQDAVERASAQQLAVFSVPPGYLLTDGLAATLIEQDRPLVWLRLHSEDADPATFLLSLIAAGERIAPGIGATTVETMRAHPGPAAGWPRLFSLLGREFEQQMPRSAAIVFENAQHLNATNPVLGLLAAHFMPALSPHTACFLISEQSLPLGALPSHLLYAGVAEMRIDAKAALGVSRRAALELPSACVERLVNMSEGRAGSLADIVASVRMLGSSLVGRILERAKKVDDLMRQIAGAWLQLTSRESESGLAIALNLGYSHAALLQVALNTPALPAGPWLQPLTDGWVGIRRSWHTPLTAVLATRPAFPDEAAQRAATYLIGQGATEQAVSLFLSSGNAARAAEVIEGAAERLMDLGQWGLLNAWLGRLPAQVLHGCPGLLYHQGEIAAASGETASARRSFALAGDGFTAQRDPAGACQALLAESTLAAWQGETVLARSRAVSAQVLAEANALPWYRAWSAWQLGCLAVKDGATDTGVYFGNAVNAAGQIADPAVAELLRRSESLSLQESELRRQSELYRLAREAAEVAQQQITARLESLVTRPPDSLPDLLDAHGWSHLPLMIKLAAPPVPAVEPADHGPWSALVRVVTSLWRQQLLPAPPPPPVFSVEPGSVESAAEILAGVPLTGATEPTQPLLLRDHGFEASVPAQEIRVADVEAVAVESPARHALSAHLLGQFGVQLDGRAAAAWPSGRSQAIFQYILVHRRRCISRDVLMDVFWPEAGAEAARNNLNVALHGARQALRLVEGLTVVAHEHGTYCLNPEIELWLDVDEFERCAAAGRKLEAAGQLAAAIAEYEAAAGLYRGDFLEEEPYEEWAILTREQLRLTYLDILDRLSRIYFSQSHYAECAVLCHLILGRDSGREDIHCRLMRCYSRQGQHHLALRQYQACVEALRKELDLAPAASTIQLYERIRRREQV